MPQDLPPITAAHRSRHCTGLLFNLPIGGEIALTASFTEIAYDADGKELWCEAESSVSLSHDELAALPAFRDAYQQLAAAVHAKRNET